MSQEKFAKPKNSGPDAVRVFAHAIKPIVDAGMERAPFKNRGLSDRTVDALVACGLDAPERLLFMTTEQIKAIPGVGPKLTSEIAAYRSRFLRGD